MAYLLWEAAFERRSEQHSGAERAMTKEMVDALNILRRDYKLNVDDLDSEGLPHR